MTDVAGRARRPALALALLGTLAGCGSPQPAAGPGVERWEADIRAFEEADRASPPQPGGVVFVGSSSIRMWHTLAEDFAGVNVVQRGFGGSEMSDAVHFADRIILPYEPRQVVVYAGDNDLWSEKSPAQVLEDFRMLVQRIHQRLPEARVAFIAIKPSIARWSIADQVRGANRLVEEYAASDPRIDYIDVFTPMLGADGMPRAELLVEDDLHLSPAGYEVWREAVGPFLQR